MTVTDFSYRHALANLPEPHVVLLGPAPCKRCGAWVEWAGADWLALGTREAHDCAPFLVNGLYRRSDLDGAAAGRLAPRSAGAHFQAHPVERDPMALPPLPWQLVVAALAVVVLVLVATGWRPA